MSIAAIGVRPSAFVDPADRRQQPAAEMGRKGDATAVADAKAALARANAQVDADKRNNSPNCVACDQKLVDKAAQSLAQARSAVGGTLDITL